MLMTVLSTCWLHHRHNTSELNSFKHFSHKVEQSEIRTGTVWIHRAAKRRKFRHCGTSDGYTWLQRRAWKLFNRKAGCHVARTSSSRPFEEVILVSLVGVIARKDKTSCVRNLPRIERPENKRRPGRTRPLPECTAAARQTEGADIALR